MGVFLAAEGYEVLTTAVDCVVELRVNKLDEYESKITRGWSERCGRQ